MGKIQSVTSHNFFSQNTIADIFEIFQAFSFNLLFSLLFRKKRLININQYEALFKIHLNISSFLLNILWWSNWSMNVEHRMDSVLFEPISIEYFFIIIYVLERQHWLSRRGCIIRKWWFPIGFWESASFDNDSADLDLNNKTKRAKIKQRAQQLQNAFHAGKSFQILYHSPLQNPKFSFLLLKE